MKKTAFSLLVAATIFFLPLMGHAMESTSQNEFQRIMLLDMASLTNEAHALLQQKYPGEDWKTYNFPTYVYTNDSVAAGYQIAVKKPEILKATFCYCFCNKILGHESLLSCFWKDGIVGGSFDDHASICNVCLGQAMATFLLDNSGATEEEIDKIWADKYKSRIKIMERKDKEK